jgi:hypothetical protein
MSGWSPRRMLGSSMTAATYLRGKGVELLYGTPCDRPEHAESENHRYYSAMFESPDRILFEVVYTGPK